MKAQIVTLALLLASPSAFGQIVVDGIADIGYGKALSVQNTETGFGDANIAMMNYANGSEIDGVFASMDADRVYLLIAGNLESNFNKIELFIDSIPVEGQNRLLGNNPDVDFNGLNRMGDDGTGNGLKFDDVFAPDWYFTGTCGGTPFATYCNLAQLLTAGGGVGGYLGSGGAGAAGVLTAENGLMWTIDNSNAAGVGGQGSGLMSGVGVVTGIELSIPRALLGHVDGAALRICAFINGLNHDYLANQVAGPLGGLGNLGESRLVDFSLLTGDQFVVIDGGVVVPPCPTDLDGDGDVSGGDLAVVLGSWGTPAADLDGDGDTNGGDLAVLLSSWGPCPN